VVEVVKIPGRRALSVAAERWKGRAAIHHKRNTGKWDHAAAAAMWCFSCNRRVGLDAMRDHALYHLRRK